VKKNFSELFSKMNPEAQERVKARSTELLRGMALHNPAVEVSARFGNCVIRLDEVEAIEGQTPAEDEGTLPAGGSATSDMPSF
jgi:hypothetical protein